MSILLPKYIAFLLLRRSIVQVYEFWWDIPMMRLLIVYEFYRLEKTKQQQSNYTKICCTLWFGQRCAPAIQNRLQSDRQILKEDRDGLGIGAEWTAASIYLKHADEVGTLIILLEQLLSEVVLAGGLENEFVIVAEILMITKFLLEELHLSKVIKSNVTFGNQTVMLLVDQLLCRLQDSHSSLNDY